MPYLTVLEWAGDCRVNKLCVCVHLVAVNTQLLQYGTDRTSIFSGTAGVLVTTRPRELEVLGLGDV